MSVRAMRWQPDDAAARTALFDWLTALGVCFDVDMNTRSGGPGTLKILGHPIAALPGWWIVRRDFDGFTYPLEADRFASFFEPKSPEEPEEPESTVAALAALAAEILAAFTLHGHPGEPCTSTGWVSDKRVNRWRARLAELSPPPDPPAT